MTIKKLFINTIGCQMNVYDSERMEALLGSMGYEVCSDPSQADLVIVNTCAIREKAEQKAFSFLGRLGGLKRKNPCLIIAAGGCVAQQEGRKILKRAPFVDIVFGTNAISRLPSLVRKVETKRTRIVDVDMEGHNDLPGDVSKNSSVSRFVTIMRGCDNFCTYCVVPYVRGRETSRRPDDIIREIRLLVDLGAREITLLGQNVNSYGKKEGMIPFAGLLAKINEINGLLRIRFTTSHPKDFSDELILAFMDLEKLCSHIHLPVQSGSTKILKRMNRKYTRETYLKKIDALRNVVPDIAITSDIIVGFPGETRQDFEMTLDLIKRVEYDSLFAFIYSDRPNAPSAGFKEKISEKEKKDRLNELLLLQKKYTIKKNRALVGSVMEILVEGFSKYQNHGDINSEKIQWSGRTGSNKIVNFTTAHEPESKNLMGKPVNVMIEDAFYNSLKGKEVRAAVNSLKGGKSYAA